MKESENLASAFFKCTNFFGSQIARQAAVTEPWKPCGYYLCGDYMSLCFHFSLCKVKLEFHCWGGLQVKPSSFLLRSIAFLPLLPVQSHHPWINHLHGFKIYLSGLIILSSVCQDMWVLFSKMVVHSKILPSQSLIPSLQLNTLSWWQFFSNSLTRSLSLFASLSLSLTVPIYV